MPTKSDQTLIAITSQSVQYCHDGTVTPAL